MALNDPWNFLDSLVGSGDDNYGEREPCPEGLYQCNDGSCVDESWQCPDIYQEEQTGGEEYDPSDFDPTTEEEEEGDCNLTDGDCWYLHGEGYTVSEDGCYCVSSGGGSQPPGGGDETIEEEETLSFEEQYGRAPTRAVISSYYNSEDYKSMKNALLKLYGIDIGTNEQDEGLLDNMLGY